MVVTTEPVDPQELIQHCAERLVSFKVPVSITVCPEIPKGPTGKVQRRLLASLVSK